MSKRNKLQKFEELRSFKNVVQNFDIKTDTVIDASGSYLKVKNKWNELYFKNDHPIVLELACGRGEYALNLAAKYPEKNFIGVDIKGARIWQGANKATELNLDNVMFFRCQIEYLSNFFSKNEVSEIWITFPDPFLRESKSSRRLTSERLLNVYKDFLIDNGLLHLKTDSKPLYEFTKEVYDRIEWVTTTYSNDDIYSQALHVPELEIKTYYEGMHLNNQLTIKYIQARLKSN